MLFYIELAAAFLCLVVPLFVNKQIVEWFGWIGFSVCVIAAMWQYGRTNGWTRAEKSTRCGILALGLVVVTFFIPFNPSERDSEIASRTASEIMKRLPESTSNEAPFHIEIPVAIVSDTTDNQLIASFMVVYKDERGDVASPINFSLYAQIANKQKFTSKISSYTVQGAESSYGPWKTLIPILPPNSELYAVQDRDLTKVMVMRYDKDFAGVLRASDFEPRENREGWAFFESLDILPSKIKFLHFQIRDTSGAETVQIIPMPMSKEGEVEITYKIGTMKFTGKRIDISKFLFKYYHSSKPS